MSRFFKIIFDIALFRAKPQDLEASWNGLLIVAICAFSVFYVQSYAMNQSINAFSVSLAQVILLGLSLRILLLFYSKSQRWLQCATALYGCGALLSALIIPIIFVYSGDLNSSTTPSLIKFIVFATSFWYLAIFIYVLRETLEIGIIHAFVMAVTMEIGFALVLVSIFGEKVL